MIKLFFKALRAVLGPILLLCDALFPPRKVNKAHLDVEAINKASRQMTLYQFVACPFCIKVRRQMKRLGLALQTRNILANKEWHEELLQEGGKRKVPCLRIEKECGSVEWLYNSKHINDYLNQACRTKA